MKKYIKYILTAGVLITLSMFSLVQINNTRLASAGGDDDIDTNIATIGFEVENSDSSDNPVVYFAEKNGGVETIKISISTEQSTDTIFTLNESIVVPDYSTAQNGETLEEWETYWQQVFSSQGNVFNYQSSYTLPANQTSMYIDLTQNSNAESINETRLRQIVLTTNSQNVVAGYDPTNTGLRSILNVYVYDTNSTENSIILVKNNADSNERDGFRNFTIIRTGDNSLKSVNPSFQYKLINYDVQNEKELQFETTQSTYLFKIVNGKYEREATLKLKFFDNDRLNWQSVYTLQFSNFVTCGTKYLNNNLNAMINFDADMKTSFFIEDDELAMQNNDGMIVLNLSQSNPFIRPEENYDAVLPEEYGELSYEIYTRPSTGKNVEAYRLFYSIDFNKTSAVLGTDFVMGQNYSVSQNVGYIDFAETDINEDSIGILNIEPLNNNLLDGARTLYLQFFLSDENTKILLPAKDFLSLAIWDDEYLAENNTISWANSMFYFGVPLTDGVASFNSTIPDYILSLDTDYDGNMNYSIPIQYTDVTTQIGVDYDKNSVYDYLTIHSYMIGEDTFYYWGTNLNAINNGMFYGTKRLQVTILADSLPEGFTISGSASIYVDFVGDYEKDYFYVDNSNITIYRDEDLSFTVYRNETSAYTNYITLQNSSNLVEGQHYQTGLFPYAINWQEGETEKQITIPFLNFTSSTTDFWGTLIFQNSNQNDFDRSFGDQYTSLSFTLINSFKQGEFYFGLNEYTYLTSIGWLEVEVMRTSSIGVATVDYALTDLLGLTEEEMAEIGVDIDDIHGTLTFQNGETLKTISITIPALTSKIVNKKIGLMLSNPSRYSGISQEQIIITINDDTAPHFAFSPTSLSHTNGENIRFYPVNNQNTNSASFEIAIVATENRLPVDAIDVSFVMYSLRDMYDEGIEVWINGQQISATSLSTPYEYDGKTYNFAYYYETDLSKNISAFEVVFMWNRIYDILPIFAGNFFNVNASSPNINIDLTNVLISAEPNIQQMPTISMTLDDDTIGNNDSIAITISRSWQNNYLRQSFKLLAVGGENNMYEPLNEIITFEPFQKEILVLFHSLDGNFNINSNQPTIRLLNLDNSLIQQINVYISSNTTQELIKLQVGFSSNEEVEVVEVEMEKTVFLTFSLSRTYMYEITIPFVDLHPALSATSIVFPAGVSEVTKTFTIDGLLLTQTSTSLRISRNNLPLTVNDITLSVRSFQFGWKAISTLSTLGIPEVQISKTQIYEDSSANLSIVYPAGETPLTSLPQRLIYCELLGSAVLGVDYILKYGSNIIYDTARGAFVIPSGTNSLQGTIKTLRTNEFGENKTITFVFYELTEEGVRFAERTYNVEILQNDTYGQFSFTSTKLENENYQIELTNNKNTGIPFAVALKLDSYLGVYGADYVITNATFIDQEYNLVYVNFDGTNQKQYIFVEFLTTARCSLSLSLEIYPTSHIEVLNEKVNISSSIHATPDIIDELENAETAMNSYATSSEVNYYFDYQYKNYYYYYLSGNASFVANRVDVYGNGILYDVIYTYKTNAGKIITTAKISKGTYTSFEIAIPSKVNAINWTDVNGDGTKEMIFASCYPYSFYGGNDEADDYGKFGVYYIDFINGQVGEILPLTKAEANRYIEFYISDLTCDGIDEIAVFVQNSNVALDRYNSVLGNNAFYILSNTAQTGVNFEIGYYESGYRVIDGKQMRLVNINSYNYDYEVPHIVLRYIEKDAYDVYSNRLLDSTCVSKSLYGHEKYKNISINYIPSEVVEGENFSFNMHNPSGLAGTFTINYEGITAVAIRDFAVNGLVTYSFRQGETNKNISIPILNNYLPNDDLTFRVTLTSQDYFLGNKTEFVITIKDRTTINKNITYTFQDSFNVDLSVNDANAYENINSYITGNNAIITAKSLIINGLSAYNSSRYFPRLTATFGGVSVVDDNYVGYLNLTNLIQLSNGQDGVIVVKIDLMAKDGNEITNRVLSSITINIPYLHYSNYQTSNIITTTDQIAVGQKASIEVYSSFDGGIANAHKISVTYVNAADNTTQTYYSDGSGKVRFSVNGGNISAAYSNSYTVNNLTTGASQTYEHILNVYGQKISARITATSDINASILGSVKIKIVGVDVTFFAEGTTNSSTGIFTTELIPFKTYRISFNEGNAINYLNEITHTLTNAKFENSIINMNLTLRNQNTQIKNVRVFIHNKEQIVKLADGPIYELYYGKGGGWPFNARSFADFIYSYLNGTLRRDLVYQEQLLVRCYFEALTDNIYMERMGLSYQIGNDLFLGRPDLKIYKSLQKEESDVIVISYQYYPVYSAATVTLNSSGIPLTSSNAIMLNYNTTDYYGNSYQQFFVARTGISDNLIDMEITSESYSTGTKTIQLVSLGAAMGRMLAGGINEQLSQIKTAEVPAFIKFMDGMSFALSFAGQEIGYVVDEEEQTMSIYIGLSKGIFERSHGASYANQDRPTLAELRGAKQGGILSSGRGGFGFGIGLGGKMHFKYVDEEWRLMAGEIYVAVSASYNYTKYFLIPVVSFPAFFSATVTLTITNTVMFDWNATECHTDVTGELAIALALEIEVGLGIRGFFSASVFALGTMEVVIQYHTGGAKLTLSVCGGVRIQIIFWKYEYIFAETSWSTQSDGYVERGAQSAVYSTKLKNMMPSTSYAGVAKVMNNNGEVAMEMALNQSGEVEDITVIENIYESAVPQLAELSDGTKMIAWINQDATRGTNNSELINYIYYNGEEWSDVGVMDTSLTADLYFDLKPYGNTFAISYSEVKMALGAGATLSDRLQLSEIAFSVFDKNTMTFSKVRLTDNNFNDRIVIFEMTGDTGIMVVYQSQNDDINDEMTLNEFLCGENSNNRLIYSIYSQGAWGTFRTLESSLPAIVNLSLKIVSSIAYIAIETDNDNNFDTDIDREIVLIQYIFANQVISKTVITENEVADTDPSLSSFNGNLILVFKSGDDVVCVYNNNYSTITTLPAGQPNFSFYSNENYAVLLWSQAVDGKSQIFASIMTADTNVFSAPYQVTTGENNKSNAFATMNNDNLFVYYCEDIYTPVGTDGEFTVARNIKLTAVDLFSDLQIEVPYVGTSSFTPNSNQTIVVRIFNNGNIAVENPSVSVDINGVITNYEITAIIPGLSYIDYEIELIMPQTKTSIVFSVEKENLIESNLDNNVTSIDLMKVDLAISGYTITRTQTGLQLMVTIENKSNVNANNIILSLTKYSDQSVIFDSLNISSLTAKTQATYTLNIDNADITYNLIQIFWSKLFILTPDKTIYTVGDDDYNTENNVRSLSIKRAQLEGDETLLVFVSELNLYANQTYIINYIYTGTGTLDITSSNSQIVSVENNVLTAITSGSATITLTDGTATWDIDVVVENNSYVMELQGNQTEYLTQGQTYIEYGITCLLDGEQAQGTLRTTNPVDIDIVGTYEVLYEFVVNENVVASVSRTVVVKPQTAYGVLSNGVISGYAMINSTVILYNSNNVEVARTIAENGQFSFAELTNSDEYDVVVLVEGVESDSLSFTFNAPESQEPSYVAFIIISLASLLLLAGAVVTTILVAKKRVKKA